MHDETAEPHLEELLAEEQLHLNTWQPVLRLFSAVTPDPAWRLMKSAEKAFPYKLAGNTMGDAKCRCLLESRVTALLERRVVPMCAETHSISSMDVHWRLTDAAEMAFPCKLADTIRRRRTTSGLNSHEAAFDKQINEEVHNQFDSLT